MPSAALRSSGTDKWVIAAGAEAKVSVPNERKAAMGISDNLVRISIGVEKAEDLIADFDNALNAV